MPIIIFAGKVLMVVGGASMLVHGLVALGVIQ